MRSSTVERAKEIQSLVPHSQAEQVRAAMCPKPMGVYLSFALGQDVTGRKAIPPCRILDVKYEPGDYCTIHYQLGEQWVIGHMRWDETGMVPPASACRIDWLGMDVYPFPNDPWLPGLSLATDPRAIAAALTQALPACRAGQARVLRVRAAPQRYRPGKRYTLRLDVVLQDTRTGDLASRTYFAKVYHKGDKAEVVYQEMQRLADCTPVREGRVQVAAPAAFLPELTMILQEPVSGVPLEDLFGPMEGQARAGDPRGWDGACRAAAALAAVHTAGLTAQSQRSIESELRRFQKRAAQVKAIDAVQGEHLGELAAALPAWLPYLDNWGATLSLIHGDCKPSQFLISSDHVAILDFDHAGMADPANDVGTFLATLRQLGLNQSLKARGDAPSAARASWLLDLEKRFLGEYCAASSAARSRNEGFYLRATWYEAVALMRKALRAFGRSPFSPLPGELVDLAWRCLAELPSAGE